MNRTWKQIILLIAVAFALTALWITGCIVDKQKHIENRILSVEKSLRPAMHVQGQPVPAMSLLERMKHHKVPGVSVAVINNGKVEWEKGYGVSEAGSQDSVTSQTLFQAASISKPVTAFGALRLVEQEKLVLDDPVNDRLVTWKIPDNAFTKQEKVTLRRLLTHTAGLTVHGFPGYTVNEEQPTIVEILDGQKPANTPPIRVDQVPGSGWRYSGGGYTVAQLLINDVTGQPFAEWMKSAVLEPVGMESSTFEQPLPPEKAARAASAHRSDGNVIPGKWHVYPELAAAGLWTTAGDLCRFAVAVQKGVIGDSGLITRKTAEAMLTPGPGNWGLGPAVSESVENRTFSHGGGNEGFRCQLYAYVEGGRGAAVMTNSDHGSDLAAEILRGIASVYDWPSYRSQSVETIDIPADSLKSFTGDFRYNLQPQLSFKVTVKGGQLHVSSPPVGELDLVPVSKTEFVQLDNGYRITFLSDEYGAFTRMKAVPFESSMELTFTRKERIH